MAKPRISSRQWIRLRSTNDLKFLRKFEAKAFSMRLASIILLCHLVGTTSAQTLHLTSVQHELRWLDEYSFPPLVNDQPIRDSLLQTAARTLAAKYGSTNYT